MTGRVGALVPAAGSGDRLGGGPPKALRLIGDRPMLSHAVQSLLAAGRIDVIVVAAPPSALRQARAVLEPFGPAVRVVAGGASRPLSVRAALAELPDDIEVVLVHDAARPFVPVTVVRAVIERVLGGCPAVVPVIPVADTVKQIGTDGRVAGTPPRAGLRAVQTPQGFRRDILAAAHRRSDADDVTDDAGLVERLGCPVWTVPGAPEAFKVTGPMDVLLAEGWLRGRSGG